jgi:toxin HigB-1
MLYVIHNSDIFYWMIISFRDNRTARFSRGEFVKEFSGFARQAEVRLDRLDAATSLDDLLAFRGNRLEALKGDKLGWYSIRINDQWRICFMWRRGAEGPEDVEILDYH